MLFTFYINCSGHLTSVVRSSVLGVVTLHNKEKKHEKLYIKFIKAGTWQA
jgi:hypothetical protein